MTTPLRCRFARLPIASLDDGRPPPGWTARHLERCLGCRAELARHRLLLRRLAELDPVPQRAPSGFVAEVVRRLTEPAPIPRRRPVLVGLAVGGGALGALGAAAVGLWMAGRRSRAARA